MKTTSVQLLLLLCIVSVFISCRKHVDTVSNKTNLLTQESWAYDQFGIDQNHDGQIDIPENLEDCSKDDIITFNAGGSGTFNQGTDLCYPTFPTEQPFDWSFLNNETQIEYAGTVHNILELNETELAIYTEEDESGTMVRHILIYKR